MPLLQDIAYHQRKRENHESSSHKESLQTHYVFLLFFSVWALLLTPKVLTQAFVLWSGSYRVRFDWKFWSFCH